MLPMIGDGGFGATIVGIACGQGFESSNGCNHGLVEEKMNNQKKKNFFIFYIIRYFIFIKLQLINYLY